MKSRLFVAVGLSLLIVALAAQNSPQPVNALPNTQAVNTTEYLIVLPMPAPETLEVPVHLNRQQAIHYAWELTFQQAEPLLAELRQQQAAGKMIDFEVQPEQHAIAVRITQGRNTEFTLNRLATVGTVLPGKNTQSACVANSAQALSELVFALSQQADRDKAALPSNMSATNPSIQASVPPTSSPDTYTHFSGNTNANSLVTMRILRNDQVIGTGSTTSSSSGRYSFYPDYQDCPDYGYTWVLRAGDVIEVTAAGNTVSTTVVNISAWADPVANVVGGVTAPGRTVNAEILYYGSDLCFSNWQQLSALADGSGNFNVNFTGVADFDRAANAYVGALDANGNGTYYSFYPYQINAEFDNPYIEGYLRPNVPFTATLSRGGVITSTTAGTSSATGYYSAWLGMTIVPGDVIAITSGPTMIQLTVAPLNSFAINTATNQATGKTTPGRRVGGGLNKRTSGYVRTSCTYNAWCHSVIADGSGNFALTAGGDLVRGDYVYLYIYDAEGNYQYGQFTSPAIVAQTGNPQIQGYWRRPENHLTVILKNNSGTAKETRTNVYANYEGRFSTWLYSASIVAGDRIEVGNGIVTETMTVQNVTGRFDGGTGHFTGSAANGNLLAQLWDFHRENGSWWGYCTSTTVSSGNYDVSFSGAQPGAQDYASAYSTGADGHYTLSRSGHAFSINGVKDSVYQGWVSGYSETPFASITITLRTGATTKSVYTGTTSSNGNYGVYLSAAINQGNTLQVQTNDGDNATLTIPELTVNKDAGANRLFGRAPANDLVETRLWRYLYDPYYEDIVSYGMTKVTAASSTGDYSGSYGGLYWWEDCSAAQMGHPCVQGQATYYNPVGHSVGVYTPPPSSVTADLYESDDVSSDGSSYTGVQHHTFHVVTDTDWITFTVPAPDVLAAVQYRLASFNVGAGVSSHVTLYDTDASTQLANTSTWDGGRFTFLFAPPAAGTYYLQIEQSDSYFIPNCDAVYDLLILPERFKVYLPLIRR